MTWRWRSRLAQGLDAIWPRVCPVADCARPSDRAGRHLCSRCFAALPFHEAGGACRICGMIVPAKTDAFVCEDCATHPPAYEHARAALRFVDPVRALVEDYKYRHATWLTEDFVDLLEGAARAKLDAAAIDLVLPVPLHPRRLRERGYNQSALLAASLARRLDRRYDDRPLVRVRDIEHQARLTAEARRTNPVGAFGVVQPAWVRGRTILLVDDVMTTGATLSCCAQPLLDAGACRVWCLVLARSQRQG